MTQSHVSNLLKSINYPGFSRDIVSFGLVKGIQVSENQISINMAISTQNQKHTNQYRSQREISHFTVSLIRFLQKGSDDFPKVTTETYFSIRISQSQRGPNQRRDPFRGPRRIEG